LTYFESIFGRICIHFFFLNFLKMGFFLKYHVAASLLRDLLPKYLLYFFKKKYPPGGCLLLPCWKGQQISEETCSHVVF
jgi:uncharacterized protein (DUF3820 family)